MPPILHLSLEAHHCRVPLQFLPLEAISPKEPEISRYDVQRET